jgi:gliding motility-associated-like protein
LVTNFSDDPGFIRLVQTNFGEPNSGTTVCCNVGLGEDIVKCANSVTLNALDDITDPDNVPSTFQWYFNNTLIDGATNSTYEAAASGTYKVTGTCGLNPVEDEIIVTLSPPITVSNPNPYIICDDATNDGLAQFDLSTITGQILVGLDPTLYTVTYHTSSVDANATPAVGAINVSVPFTNILGGQTIYIRIQNNALTFCFSVVELQLIVQPLPIANFNYSAIEYCKNNTTSVLLPIYQVGGVAGIYSYNAIPSTAVLAINTANGEIDLPNSDPGTYVITNTIVANNACAEIVSLPITISIYAPSTASFNYGVGVYCNNDIDVSPTFTNGSVAGLFSSNPSGLTIDSATGVVTLASSLEGVYTVTNTILANGACSGDVQQSTITVFESINGTISYDFEYCKSTTTIQNVLNTVVSLTPGVYSSTPVGLSLDSVTGAINPNLSDAGNYDIVYTIAATNAACGEFKTNVFSVKIIEQSITKIEVGCEANDYLLKATVTKANGTLFDTPSTYSWTGPNFISTSKPEEVKLLEIGTYSVLVTTPDGCTSTQDVQVTDISCSIQRGISPGNGDNLNNCFDLTTLKVNKLEIFNRYGLMVYSKINYTDQWCGQSDKGDDLPDGTYYYVIERDTEKPTTGWVYISREIK